MIEGPLDLDQPSKSERSNRAQNVRQLQWSSRRNSLPLPPNIGQLTMAGRYSALAEQGMRC